MGIVEILLFLIVALIVIPPERLPEVMRAVGKILRELRLASNTVVRELSGALDDPPYMGDRPHDNPMTRPLSERDSGTPVGNESPSAPTPSAELPPSTGSAP